MVLKKVVGDKVIMYGETQGPDACHNCISLDKEIQSRKENSEIPIEYEHHSINNTPEGQKLMESGVDEIPYSKVCKIAEDKTEQCDTIIGYNPKKWEHIGKAREEEFKETT